MINYGLDKDCAFRKRLDLGTLMDFHAQNVAIRLEFFGINGCTRFSWQPIIELAHCDACKRN